MPFSYRELFFGKTRFCCCIPVRLGVTVMAVLGLVFSAVLSIILWYQVSVNHTMSPGVRAAFVIGGLVETFLFAALVGSIVRKLSFVRMYATITYVHFVLNLGVAIWFLVVVVQATNNANNVLCDNAGDARSQCTKLFSFGRTTYIVLAVLVLLIELYGALIVTRYVWQLNREKSYRRQTRQGIEDAFRLEAARARYSTLASSHELTPLGSPMYNDYDGTEYDPYREASVPPPVPPAQTPRRFKTFVDQGRPAAPVEMGYGGGTWTHEEISEEEKERLKKQEQELGLDIEAPPPMDETEVAIRRSEIKSVGGPTTTPYAYEADDLPHYPYPSLDRPVPRS
ncbi:hypothetical protein AN958_11489 [Leucoagaricus sp. SymC.cos]|nr:hypothetical protein AN958_11489 [Leucoagaricus sp. SymC.cos]